MFWTNIYIYTAAQQPLTTQAPVPITNYQTFWVTVPYKTTSTPQQTVLAYPTSPDGEPAQGPPGPKGSKGEPGLPGKFQLICIDLLVATIY